jgi:hypothetical protein
MIRPFLQALTTTHQLGYTFQPMAKVELVVFVSNSRRAFVKKPTTILGS